MAKIEKGRVVFETTESKWGYIKGTGKWAHVLSANDYGNFSIDVYGDDVEELGEELQEVLESAKKEIEDLGKDVDATAPLIKENDEDGKYIQFKLKETNWEGKPNSINIYNKHGDEDKEWDKLIGNGSTVKVKYQATPYYMTSTKTVGISYKFYAIQVIDLVEYTATESGFNDESDGEEF